MNSEPVVDFDDADKLKLLYSLSSLLNNDLNLDTLAGNIISALTQSLAPDFAVLYVVNDQYLNELKTYSSPDIGEWNPGERHCKGKCLCGLAASGGQPIFSKDINIDPRCAYTECKEAGLTSFAAIPLVSHDSVLGVLGVASKKMREFAEEELLLSIRGIVSTALHNALLLSQTRESLEEKTMLLRELHHRVKNNLQVITSLVRLQTNAVESPELADALSQTQNRIRAMALVHEHFYGSGNLKSVDFGHYLEGLVRNLHKAYGRPSNVQFQTDCDKLMIPLEQSITLGLAANELVTNCMKHAFVDLAPGEQGKMNVRLQSSGKWAELTIEDNGRGLGQDFVPSQATSMGMQLLNALAQQLEGTLRVNPCEGTSISIRFPVKSEHSFELMGNA